MANANPISPLSALREDMERYGIALPEDRWAELTTQVSEQTFGEGDVIMSSARVADHWLFVSQGIVASEQTTQDGDALIARFFEPGQICSNISSAWRRALSSDTLIAVTQVEGIFFPDAIFRAEYLRGGVCGEYLRIKAIETLLFDKDLLCAKTSNDTEVRYSFLEQNYAEVVARTTQKDRARFVGLTPQGLNRFLKARKTQT